MRARQMGSGSILSYSALCREGGRFALDGLQLLVLQRHPLVSKPTVIGVSTIF
jgi:hypothetical protein